MKQKVLNRMSNPLKELFKDCPKLVNSLDATLSPMIDEDKSFIDEDKKLKNEFQNLSKEEKSDLLTIHAYDFFVIEKLIFEYEKCN